MSVSSEYYSYWAKQITWSVREALNVVVRYFISGCTGDHETLEDFKYERRSEYWWRMSRAIKVFAVDTSPVVYEDISEVDNNGWYMSEKGEVITRIDQDRNLVDPYRFLRWAFSEGIKLPEELLSLLNNNTYTANAMVVEPQVTDISNGLACPVSATAITLDVNSPEYKFEKFGHSWNIQFGDELLRGVKHRVGMDYIKVLLQHPYNDIGVFQLQALLNPDTQMFSVS